MPIEVPPGLSMSDEVLEAMRLRAIRARELGFKCDDVASIFGVAPETVFALVVGIYERRRGRAAGRPKWTPARIGAHAHG